MDSRINSQKLGMLLGLHVGDSLGSTLEFKDKGEFGIIHTEITGGGVFNWVAGAPTDDTEMMIALLESIAKNKKFDQVHVANEFLKWAESNPKDIGNTIAHALALYKNGVSLEECGRRHEFSQGNGSLMRCAPLALLSFSDEVARQQCRITHAHEMCIFCDQVYVLFLKDLLDGKSKQEAYLNLIKNSKARSDYLRGRILEIESLNLDEFNPTGFVVDTLVGSVLAFLSTDNFEDALVRIVNLGGDADTYGAVTGAIAGAHYGLDGIPKRWRDAILKKDKIVLAYLALASEMTKNFI